MIVDNVVPIAPVVKVMENRLVPLVLENVLVVPRLALAADIHVPPTPHTDANGNIVRV